MLKLKALKAAQMAAQKKADEADALREDAAEAEAEVGLNGGPDSEGVSEPAVSTKKVSLLKMSALKASKLRATARQAEAEAQMQVESVKEAEEKLEAIPDGPKKMLKLKALKAAKMKAEAALLEAEILRSEADEEDEERCGSAEGSREASSAKTSEEVAMEEQKQEINNMPEGPKKMLKMKALKATELRLQREATKKEKNEENNEALSIDPKDEQAETVRAAEEEAAAHEQVVKEQRQAISKMAEGPIKRLKMKALRMTEEKAEQKRREAADLKAMGTRVGTRAKGGSVTKAEAADAADRLRVAQEEAAAHQHVVSEERRNVEKMVEGPLKRLKIKALKIAQQKADEKSATADALKVEFASMAVESEEPLVGEEFKITIILDGDYDTFDTAAKSLVSGDLASCLNIAPELVYISGCRAGSIIVEAVIRVPQGTSREIIEAVAKGVPGQSLGAYPCVDIFLGPDSGAVVIENSDVEVSAENLQAELMDAVADAHAVEEERREVEQLKEGPKKMLKMKALKMAALKAEMKKKEAADALTELTRQEEIAVIEEEKGKQAPLDLSKTDVINQLDEMSAEEVQYTRKMAEDEALAQQAVVSEEKNSVSKMKEGPMKALKIKALQLAQIQANEKRKEAEAFKEYDEKRADITASSSAASLNQSMGRNSGFPDSGFLAPTQGPGQASPNQPAGNWRGTSSLPGRSRPEAPAPQAAIPMVDSPQAQGQGSGRPPFSAKNLQQQSRSPIKFEVGDLKHRVIDLEKMIDVQNSELEKLMSKLDRNTSGSRGSSSRAASAGSSRRVMDHERHIEASDRAFEALDADHDGVISREEWLAVYGNMAGR